MWHLIHRALLCTWSASYCHRLLGDTALYDRASEGICWNCFSQDSNSVVKRALQSQGLKSTEVCSLFCYVDNIAWLAEGQ